MNVFGIVIPVYNLEHYVSDCLESLKAQTYSHWKAVIVDDGSTDGSLQAIQSAVDGDDRFTVITQDNQGVGQARNQALSVLLQDKAVTHIGFLDGDDYFSQECLEQVNTALSQREKEPECVVFGYKRFTDSEGWTVGKYDPNTYWLEKPQTFNTYMNLDDGEDTFLFTHTVSQFLCNRIFNKELLRGIRFKSIKVAEDQYVLLALLQKISTICVIPHIGLYYRFRLGSASENNDKQIDVQLALCRMYRDTLASLKEDSERLGLILAKCFAIVAENLVLRDFKNKGKLITPKLQTQFSQLCFDDHYFTKRQLRYIQMLSLPFWRRWLYLRIRYFGKELSHDA